MRMCPKKTLDCTHMYSRKVKYPMSVLESTPMSDSDTASLSALYDHFEGGLRVVESNLVEDLTNIDSKAVPLLALGG